MLAGFAETFVLEIDGISEVTPYSYDPLKNNKNDRAIKLFSSNAGSKMKHCQKCEYFRTFDKFYEYYYLPDYADRIVEAAFQGTQANLNSHAFDFSSTTMETRGAVIERTTSIMHVLMFVLQQLEESIHACMADCPKEGCDGNANAVHLIDAAVAFYTGSQEGHDGSGDGNLLYNLADEECRNFGTCGSDGNAQSGTSKVNLEIMELFSGMKEDVSGKHCPQARRKMDRIEQIIFLPVVQGTLRYAYQRAHFLNSGELDEALAAIYSASVLPVVNDCSISAGNTLNENLRQGSNPDLFAYDAIKKNLERQYQCMGFTCTDVGAYGRSQACEDGSAAGLSPAGHFGIVLVVLIGFVALGWMIRRRRRRAAALAAAKRSNPDYNDDDDEDDDDSLSDASNEDQFV